MQNTYWHRYYTGITGVFHEDYIPLDIFRSIISFRLNQKRQWPSLLDKNLTYKLFKEFKQPTRIVQNINGFYYVNEKIVDIKIAAEACNDKNKQYIIKPTLESGKGKMVEVFTVVNNITTIKNLNIFELFDLYHKDFIIQELVEQSNSLKILNPSSLNTLRIISYLNNDGVHILSSAVRIGEPGNRTDNFSGGGMFCGINDLGNLKSIGHTKSGEIKEKTLAGTLLKGCEIPNYDKVLKMVCDMHIKIPYFKIVSWDIGIDKSDMPMLI
ncbi:sugar-transfer associated ATP-grasp domain-containing protein [Winogradskyella sp. PG-2]|uniref:sugar-transfer associated ATP-grasp domain-containing protein n=1 Tax=Winogradskyella sp. PG-2 TaxID=754409 RepID=UPI00045890DE|nr:sugar-transfer associated ATP-grasp domain-containing protein [Winogradskyella sp. PG-2]BAO77621.1 putative hexapeptide transferase family protein [Winogradskyella sp. PG-2]